MMKINFTASLVILFLSLGSFAQTTQYKSYFGVSSPSTKNSTFGYTPNAFDLTGTKQPNNALHNLVFGNTSSTNQITGMDCEDSKPSSCGINSDFNQVSYLGKSIVDDGILRFSVESCYDIGVNKCSFNPDIRSVCGCINSKADKTSGADLKKIVTVDDNFVSGEKAAKNMMATSTRLLLMSSKEFNGNLKECINTSNLSPQERDICNSKLKEFQKKQAKFEEIHKKQMAQMANSSGTGGSKSGLVEPEIPEAALKYKDCFSYNNYLPDSEIPMQSGIDFVKYQTAINKNPTSHELDARDFILKKILSGNAIVSKNDYANEPDGTKAQIAKMIDDGSLYGSFTSLKVYVTQNPYWKEIMKNDPVHGFNKFKKIFETSDPKQIREEASIVKNSPEVQKMIAAEAIKKDELLTSVFNTDGTLKAQNSKSFYLNPVLINKKFQYEGKTAPYMCSALSKSLTSEGSALSKAHSFQESLIKGCEASYKEICTGAAGQLGQYKTDDDLNYEANLGAAIDYMLDDRLLESSRLEGYLKSAENLCNNKHKLDSKFKLGKNAEISRDEFKRAICNDEPVGKDQVKIKLQFKNESEKARACGTGSQSEAILTSYYVASLSEDDKNNVDLATQVSTTNLTDIEAREEKEKDAQFIASMSGGFEDSGDDSLFSALSDYAKGKSPKGVGVVPGTAAVASQSGNSDIMGQISSSLNKAATTISSPVVDNNVQNYMQGNLPVNNIYPADFNNTDPSQVSSAKASVDKGMSQIEQRLDSFEKSKVAASDAKKDEEIALLRKQLDELKGQSELLKAQLDKGSDNKVAEKVDDTAVSGSRSPASTDYKGISPQVSSATQQGLGAQSVQPSKVFDNLYGDSSFHGVPTINGSKSIDSKAFSSRSSNDALLSIYTDKSVSGLVDSVASTSNSNILVVGNALEMQESTIKSKNFQTKEIVVDQKILDQARSNPDALRTLIEKNKMNNHEGILTLKTGESQLNYIMRKDDAGKLVILPLNIARKVTLDNLKNELIRN